MREQAFTLFEVLVVVLVVAITGLAVHLADSDDADLKLELAAGEVAAALRFARSEALRTGEERGVRVGLASGEIKVFEADLSSGSIVVVSDLINPFDKRPYVFEVGKIPGAAGVEIANVVPPFRFSGLPQEKRRVLFDASDTPFFLKDGVVHRLVSGTVELGYGSDERKVVLSPIGRVTVQ